MVGEKCKECIAIFGTAWNSDEELWDRVLIQQGADSCSEDQLLAY